MISNERKKKMRFNFSLIFFLTCLFNNAHFHSCVIVEQDASGRERNVCEKKNSNHRRDILYRPTTWCLTISENRYYSVWVSLRLNYLQFNYNFKLLNFRNIQNVVHWMINILFALALDRDVIRFFLSSHYFCCCFWCFEWKLLSCLS